MLLYDTCLCNYSSIVHRGRIADGLNIEESPAYQIG